MTSLESSKLVPNEMFARLASDEQIKRTSQALEAHGIHTLIAANGEEARKRLFELLPEGAEVFLGLSATLKALGVIEDIDNSGRARLAKMDRTTQNREFGDCRQVITLFEIASGILDNQQEKTWQLSDT